MFKVKAIRNFDDEDNRYRKGDAMDVQELTNSDPVFASKQEADTFAHEWEENYAGIEFYVVEVKEWEESTPTEDDMDADLEDQSNTDIPDPMLF